MCSVSQLLISSYLGHTKYKPKIIKTVKKFRVSAPMISSIVASTKTDMLGPYSVSKAALSALVRQLSRELAAKNIRINSVEPGVVKTDFATVLHDPKSPYSKMLDNFDMKRAGEPEEIANLVKFLSSEEASFITGESHRICGGSPGW